MYIDCHVHLRDDDWEHKETIAHGLRVADAVGLDAVFDMPNPDPPVTSRARVLDRFRLAQEADSPVFYGVYVGLTSDKDQIREAVECWREFFPGKNSRVGVIGMKMFAGKSVGNLSVTRGEEQEFVYSELVRLKYDGVTAVHCEKESLLRPQLWDATNPWTWNFARPATAEMASIVDQIIFATANKYQGHLHICHVSCLGSARLVDGARASMRISCGVTPHHLLIDTDDMQGEDGILYKVNPPIRGPSMRAALMEEFLSGRIDILESDHAPHTLQEKREKHMSGIPNLASWPVFTELLKEAGALRTQIYTTAFHNVNRIFGTSIQRRDNAGRGGLVGEYAFDPYSGVRA